MIIFMGVAGAGKSVQGTMLAEKLGYQWLSTGEYLRANISGERKKEMLAGKLLDDNEIIDILKNFFSNINDQNKTILDGFPRTLTQAKWILNQHHEGNIEINSIVYLVASIDVVKKRLLNRGRQDDNEDVLTKRFEEYQSQTLPIIDWLKAEGITIHEIDAERSVNEIHGEILSKINQN